MIDNGIFTFLKSFQKVVMQREPPLCVEKLNRLIVEAEVPLNEKTVKRYVINWADNMKMTDEEIRNSFAKFKKREKEDGKYTGEIERKIVNTISFYKFVQSLKS